MPRPSSPADPLWQASLQALQDRDFAQARRLLIQTLRRDPGHVLAWLSLAKIGADAGEQLYCLRQAGALNPHEARIRQAYRDLKARFPQAREKRPPELAPPPRETESGPFTPESAPELPVVPPFVMAAEDNFGDLGDPFAALEVPPLATTPVDTPAPAADADDHPFAVPVAPSWEAAPPEPEARPSPPMPRRRTAIRTLDPRRTLRQAAQKQQEGNAEAALELYLDVLDLDPAQSEALAGAVRLLTRQRRFDGAAELVEKSIDAGNQDPAAYVSLAELRLLLYRADPWEPLVALGRLPGVKAAHFLRAADLYWQHGHQQEALATLHEAERRDPTHQPTLVKLAETYKMMLDKERAKVYYQRAVDLGTRSEAGRAAEEFLTEVAPYIPRYVQTNMLYALREVLALVVVYFLLALLDAGLNLLGIEAAGWLGVGLSLLGGYLLVTATSSPAQHIFQPLLGGAKQGDNAPPRALPQEMRWALGVVGGVFLLLALGMVLRHSLVNAGATLETMRQGYIPDFVFDLCRQLPPWFCTF